MNDHRTASSPPSLSSLEAQQARFALRVTARLTEHTLVLGPDVTERLRFAREHAVQRARALHTADAAVALGSTRAGAAVAGWAGSRWWVKLASVAPVLALVAGLVLIQRWNDQTQISAAAEVDAALLSDDLPPTAYSDAGFAEFLKASSE
jgi:hypothetical protein